MSLDLEERLKTFLASAPQNIRAIQTLELSHPAMSQTYYFWREPYSGTITLEDDSVVTVEPLSMEINLAGSENHLDQQFEITLDTVDSEDTFRDELDSIPLATTDKIAAVYREYLSDDLTTPQATVILQVENIAYTRGAAKISAVSPRLNVTRTGDLYSNRNFPMLRGFTL